MRMLSRSNKKSSRGPAPSGVEGFTLVEMLVAMGLFVLIGGAVLNLVVSSIAGQRSALANQTVVDQVSSTAEYMSRVIRQAQKDLSGQCLAVGTNYQISGGGQTLRLLDKENFCREFSFDSANNAIQEQKGKNPDGNDNFDPPISFTSDDITIQNLQFFIQGEAQTDDFQPRVTFFIDEKDLQLQTTVSQRKFDVQE